MAFPPLSHNTRTKGHPNGNRLSADKRKYFTQLQKVYHIVNLWNSLPKNMIMTIDMMALYYHLKGVATSSYSKFKRVEPGCHSFSPVNWFGSSPGPRGLHAPLQNCGGVQCHCTA